MGKYASQLPSDLVYWSLRAFFLVAFLTFAAILEPEVIGICVIILMALIIIHVIHVNLSLSHVIINSGKLRRTEAILLFTFVVDIILMHC